jgi:hypothetical protein
MLRRKLIRPEGVTKKPLSKGPVKPLRKPLKAIEPDDDENEEDAEEEEEEEETPIRNKSAELRKRNAARHLEEDDEEKDVDDDEEETPKSIKKSSLKKKPAAVKGGGGLADAFDSVKGFNNADDVPIGKYEAIIRDVVLQEPDAKGQSARMHFELCSDDFTDANSVTTWFKLQDTDGEPVRGGLMALKATLAKLGYDPKGDELEAVFEEITNENPGVLIKISYTTDSNHYQRIQVDSLCDNEVVEEYKDNVKY